MNDSYFYLSLLLSLLFSFYLTSSGVVADSYGRRPTILLFTSILAIAGLGSAVAPTFAWLIVIRTVAGVGLGGTIPGTNTLMAEVTPDSSRAVVMLLIGVGFTIGECLTALESMALDVGVDENWRWLMALSALPAILSLLLSLFFLDESPRFLYAAGRREEANQLLKKMTNSNKKSWCCCCCWGSDEEEREVREEEEEHEEQQQQEEEEEKLLIKRRKEEEEEEFEFEKVLEEHAPTTNSCTSHLTNLFAAANPLDTFMVWLIFAICSLVFYGLIWVFPLTLKDGGGQEQSKDVATKVFWGAIAEIPAFLLPIFIIDRVGRRGTLLLSFIICVPIGISCAMFAPHLKGDVESISFFWSVMSLKCMVRVILFFYFTFGFFFPFFSCSSLDF